MATLSDIVSVTVNTNEYEVFFWGDKNLLVDQITQDGTHVFKYEDVESYIKKNPDLIDAPIPKIVNMTIEQMRAECDDYHYNIILQQGFQWEGYSIRADSISQQNVNGFMSAITAGVDVFPIVWRTIENVNISFADSSEFQLFAEKMMSFVNQSYKDKWIVKDNIENAPTLIDAKKYYDDYVKGA